MAMLSAGGWWLLAVCWLPALSHGGSVCCQCLRCATKGGAFSFLCPSRPPSSAVTRSMASTRLRCGGMFVFPSVARFRSRSRFRCQCSPKRSSRCFVLFCFVFRASLWLLLLFLVTRERVCACTVCTVHAHAIGMLCWLCGCVAVVIRYSSSHIIV